MPKLKNLNATFWMIFKHCDMGKSMTDRILSLTCLVTLFDREKYVELLMLYIQLFDSRIFFRNFIILKDCDKTGYFPQKEMNSYLEESTN